MENGFIKLWRSVEQNELLENDNTCFIVFFKLLYRVDWRTGTYKTGRYKLAAMCNLKPSTLRDALKRLETASMIRQQTDRQKTTIHICNWHKYQSADDNRPSVRRRADDTKQEEEKETNIYIKKKTSSRDVLKILNKVTGRNFRVEPLGIEKTKRQFSDEEIEQALKNMMRDIWHKDKMDELTSNYLLRASTIDKFKDWKPKQDKKYKDYTNKTIKPTAVGLSRKEILQREYQT